MYWINRMVYDRSEEAEVIRKRHQFKYLEDEPTEDPQMRQVKYEFQPRCEDPNCPCQHIDG